MNNVEASKSWVGREIELDVGSVAHGGHCVSRVDGRVVFVRHALPGETVIARITEDRGGSFCRADAVRILRAAADRIEPACPVAGPGKCGGCDWQHVRPQAQRELKASVIGDQLRRLAGIEQPIEVEELEGGSLGWRSRTRLSVGADGAAGLRAHRSHTVIPITDCPISVSGSLERVLAKHWRPGSELETTKDDNAKVHIRELSTVRGRRRSRQVSGGLAVQRAVGRTWRLDAHGFWQGHPAAADTFATAVAELARTPDGGTGWDLYAGVGLFSAVLAEQVGADGTIIAVESVPAAVSNGMANLSDLKQVHWRQGKVHDVIADIDNQPDVVVLDPPRKGAGRGVVDAIAEHRPHRVVYVACDPAALARDVASFADHGYRLARLRAFDAFPMTHHVESIALLIR